MARSFKLVWHHGAHLQAVRMVCKLGGCPTWSFHVMQTFSNAIYYARSCYLAAGCHNKLHRASHMSLTLARNSGC
jgi:hypothetical protein